MLCNAAAARRAEDTEGQRPWQMRKAERGWDRVVEIRIDRCIGKARQGKAESKNGMEECTHLGVGPDIIIAWVARFNKSKPPVLVFACAPSEPDMVGC